MGGTVISICRLTSSASSLISCPCPICAVGCRNYRPRKLAKDSLIGSQGRFQLKVWGWKGRIYSTRRRAHRRFDRMASAAAATAAPSAAEVMVLYRALLREARKFSNYNVREYVKRRVKEGFRDQRSMTDPAAVAAAYAHGKQSLQVARRQSLVYSLYAPQTKSIMDLKIVDVD